MRFDHRVRNLAVACALAVLLTATLLPRPASAHFIGDHWDWTPNGQVWAHWLWISYDSNCTGSRQTVVDAAASAWTATPTPLFFWPKLNCTGGQNMGQVDIFTGFDANTNNLAWTQNYDQDCFLWWCWWDADWGDNIQNSVIRVNTAAGSFDSFTAAQQQVIVVHELGHSLGLAHAGCYSGSEPAICPGYPALAYSVMDYCCPNFDVPQTHDVNDLNARYPW